MALKGSQLTSYKDGVITEEGTNKVHPRFQKWLDVLYEFVVRRQKVIDLTNAVSDYKLKVGEVAKVTISAASTALNVQVEDGVYEIRIVFDPATFAADSGFKIQTNNADHTNEFVRSALRASTGFATDEVDTIDTAVNAHLDVNGLTDTKLIQVTGSLTIMGAVSVMSGRVFGQTAAGVEHLVETSTYWPGTHTSLGTIVISEAATGVAYVRRTA